MSPEGRDKEAVIGLGFVPGCPSSFTHGPFDPLGRVVECDDDLWEEPEGIYSKYQASALLMTMPRLWKPHQDWCIGIRELDDAAIERRSAFEVDAILTLQNAKVRAMTPKKGDDG